MKIELDTENPGENKIISYSDTSFQVSDRVVSTSLVISRDKMIEDWLGNNPLDFATQHLDKVISWQPEIILLGTGKQLCFPDQHIMSYVASQHIGFEVMDTGAACRSYNLLLAEARAVVACLYLSDN